ncbi:MAG: type VI secretion system tip protein VgrG, partial [Alphaproteobacteria bacterium]|nr:type VI secretion system tip protein VgrG [Alphaproteobacteria bacterium]
MSDTDIDNDTDTDSEGGGSSSEGGRRGFAKVKIEPDPGLEGMVFQGLNGTEELGRPFHYDLYLHSKTLKADLTSILGGSATLTVAKSGSAKRHFNGIVVRASHAGLRGGAYSYHIELRPWIWLLSRTQDCKIFQNKSAWDVITSVFRDAGFSDFEDKRQSQSGDTVLDYCVQYRESSLDFVTRLMEEWGIYYYFQHDEGKHTLVLADDPNSHSSVGDAIPYALHQTEIRQVKDHIWGWTADNHLQSGSYTHTDYNFTTPSADLTSRSNQQASHPHGSLEVYDYPGVYGDTGVGQKLADVRMQQMSALRQIKAATTNARSMGTGCKFTLSQFSDEAENKEHLVVSSTVTLGGAEGASGSASDVVDTYRNSFRAIPGNTQYRLERQTKRPTVLGPQTAKVVGESGQEITTDQYGRVKCKFFWDRSPGQDENSSCWIRVAQVWAGSSFGGMLIPRIGQEVIVDFLEGNPDRPIVTGRVYNANVQVPYPLPDKKNMSTLKTNSTTGGNGFNEFRFDDTAGSEEVFFQAQKDYNKVVLNNETVKVTKDTTTTVQQGNRSVTVSQGNDSHTVSQGNNTVTISVGDHKMDVTAG